MMMGAEFRGFPRIGSGARAEEEGGMLGRRSETAGKPACRASVEVEVAGARLRRAEERVPDRRSGF